MQEKSRELMRLKKQAAAALKHAVSDNYRTFISTSREIGALEVDMADVRSLLADMNGALKELDAFKLTFGPHQIGAAAASASLDFRQRAELNAALGTASSELAWLVGVPASLDARIAERNFEAAAADAERATALLRKYAQLDAQLAATGVRTAIERGVRRLRAALEHTLRSEAADAADVRHAITLMLRLNWAEAAREAFLAQRSHAIDAAVRRLAFGGDRRQYVGDVARLVFSSIVSTCDDFVSSFTERAMLSAFVVWAVREIERFAAVFAEYVFVPGATFELMGDCVAYVGVARSCAKRVRLSHIPLQCHAPSGPFLPPNAELRNSIVRFWKKKACIRASCSTVSFTGGCALQSRRRLLG